MSGPVNLVDWASARPIPKLHVAVIGGGASGALMAVHLLRQRDTAFTVTLIEAGGAPGQGIAYSTRDPGHLLNTRVQNMSAFPDDPAHFLTWLQANRAERGSTALSFVRRGTYGDYLGSLLAEGQAKAGAARLRVIRQECVDVTEGTRGVEITLANGDTLQADHTVLATGHVQPDRNDDWLLDGSWARLTEVPDSARVVIIGSGLSMVDQVLSLLRQGHRGPIVSISRRGLLPREHSQTRPVSLTASEIPFGAPMSALLHWARGLARRAEAAGGSWRDAVDGIRPHVRRIWQALPEAERGRFLRHAATWWDVHRHRIPPQSQAAILDALRRGQLRVIKGAYTGASDRLGGGVLAHYRPFGQTGRVALAAARIVDCRGIRRDPERHASPLVAALLARGAAPIDPLRIGIDVDVDEQCRLIGRGGTLARRIRAIGPASRAAFWEITAIPDIREQVSDLARALAAVAAQSDAALPETELSGA